MCGYTCNHCGRCGKETVSEMIKTPIPGLCPECRMLNGPTAKVCKNCGAELACQNLYSKGAVYRK